MRRIVLIHYNEIALKGRNRPFFERALLGNIKRALADCAFKEARIIFGRIVIWFEADVDEKLMSEKLNKVFGIANFSFGW